MTQTTIRINGYAYTVGCEDGQEQHLTEMAAEVERRIVDIRAIGGQNGEARLLMFAALMLADELHDLKRAQPSSQQAASVPTAPAATGAPASALPVVDEEFVIRLGLVAEEAERIATILERV